MRPRVLVVEDESILASSISTYLARHGCETAVAGCGEDGVQVARESGPDVAVVDVCLPGMDGLQVLRRLREVSPATEVVMITAYTSAVSAVQAMRLGAFDYMTKPLDLDDLRVMVERAATHQRIRLESLHLRRRRVGSPPPGDIVAGGSAPVH